MPNSDYAVHGSVREAVNAAAAYSAAKLPDQGFHVLLAVAAMVDEVDPAVLEDVAFLLDRRDIGRHEVIHHSWLASALRRNLQRMLAVHRCVDLECWHHVVQLCLKGLLKGLSKPCAICAITRS